MATPSRNVRWPDPAARPDTTSLRWRSVLGADWLRLRWDRGDTLEEIAAEAGCSVSTVRLHVRRHRLSARVVPGRQGPRSWGDVLTEEFLREAYVDGGMTMLEIAAEVGCRAGTVSGWLHRHGIPTRRARPGTDNLLYAEVLTEGLVRRRIRAGDSLNELARLAGSTPRAAAGAARRAGVAEEVPEGRRPEPPCAPRGELRRLYEQGLSLEAMAARLGVSRTKVRADLDRAGLRPYARPPHSPAARAGRSAARAALDAEALAAAYDELRRRWRPRRVRIMLVNAAPPGPQGRDPFFYADGPRVNPLLRAVADALYGAEAARAPADVHRRLRSDGFWLIDACPPFADDDRVAQARAVRAARPSLVDACLAARPAIGVVVCHRLVWDEARGALDQAGVRVLHERAMPDPNADRKTFAARFRALTSASR